MTHHAQQLHEALRLYCDWLNACRTSVDDWTMTPDQFDSRVNEYASVEDIAQYEVDGQRVYVWAIDHGDDGGPAYLTVHFHGYETDWQPWNATQSFDTYLTIWLDEGKIVPVEGSDSGHQADCPACPAPGEPESSRCVGCPNRKATS